MSVDTSQSGQTDGPVQPSKASLQGYEFSSFWERAAALDASQVSAISVLGESIASAKRREFSSSITATSSIDASKSLQPGDSLTSEQAGKLDLVAFQYDIHHLVCCVLPLILSSAISPVKLP